MSSTLKLGRDLVADTLRCRMILMALVSVAFIFGMPYIMDNSTYHRTVSSHDPSLY